MTSSQRRKNAEPVSRGVDAYSVEFMILAKKEFDRLDQVVQLQLLKKLRTRLAAPRVQADKLRGLSDCYKLKLRASGVRLVYEVIDNRLVVSVIAVGRRDDGAVYEAAKRQLVRR